MKYDIDHIQELLVEKIAGTISEEDNIRVERALATDRSIQLLWEILSDQFSALEGEDFLQRTDVDTAWDRVVGELGREAKGKSARRIGLRGLSRRTAMKVSVAAACMLIAGIGSYFLLTPNERTSPIFSEQASRPTAASETRLDRDKVLLTLANGRTIVLDSAGDGVLLKTAGIEISKTTDGQLVYQVTHAEPGHESSGVNTITTPPGGRYQIILPDNSKVWLNTASSLKFPSAFSGATREVELIGEAYFDIAKNKEFPFIVKSKWGEIEVLGTGFNVMAYDDEQAMKTTLVEGSVKISGNETKVLKPGEQAILDANRIQVRPVDVNAEIAWKDNLFQFDQTSIDAIMRQAARWYNVDIKYAGKIPNRSFTGKISRDADITEFLEMLRFTGIDFGVEASHILVL